MIRTAILASGFVLFAIDARADDIDLDANQPPRPVVVVQPQQPPPFVPPRSLGEYDFQRKTLKGAIADAKRADDRAAVENLRARLTELDTWYREHTHRESQGMFVGGIVMAVLGGAALIAGLTTLAAGAICYTCSSDDQRTLLTVGGIVTGAGVLVGVGGLTLALQGGPRVMNTPDSRGGFFSVSTRF